jgi:DNA-binding NtrC family response regulator
MAHLLVVDDEAGARSTLALLLRKRGHRVVEADGVTTAAKRLAEEVFDLVVTDLRMPDGDGLDVLRTAKAQAPATEVILLTAYAEWKSAKEAIRLGALDYFEKGQEPDELYHRIDKALAGRALRRENENLRAQLRERYGLPGLVAQSAAMQAVLELVERVAPTDATLLVQGESGTGKEVIAKAVHHASRRAARPFVAVNCGAVPETLLESELFGYARGAFTGAAVPKRGLFEEADGGTLFLDEIAEMPAALQVKLLRTLQSGEVRRLGATQATTIDVRVIAATHGDLAALISQGSFREDLFYRLNVIQVSLPPLRDRREDIPALAEHFLARAAAKLGRTRRLSPTALERLLRYPWPGNVRELENAIERAAILARHEAIEPDDLPPHVTAGLPLGPSPALPRQITLAEAERIHILQTLERFGRNHSGAAEALGIGRTTLWRKLKEYGIDRA